MNPYRIVTICDDIFAETGFSNEMKNILFRFAALPEYEVHWLSLQQVGYSRVIPDSAIEDIPTRGAKIISHGLVTDSDRNGLLLKRLYEISPDIMFNVGDPHHFVEPINMKKIFPFFFIGYTTLDGLPIPPSWRPIFENIDFPICMTEWANYEFLKAGFKMGGYVHHGVNWEWWQTTEEERLRAKKRYGLEDYVIFGNWDSNQFRKQDSLLLRAWAKTNPESKKMKLFLCKDSNCRLGNNLEQLIEQYGIPRETVILPEDISPTNTKKFFDAAEPPSKHREECRLFDVYVSATAGEGFGKCALEAHALGIPVIIGDHTACSEVSEKGSILIPVKSYYRPRDSVKGVDLSIIDEDKLAEAIVYLYNNKEERRELGAIGREFAKQFDYDEVIFPAWKEMFKRFNPDTVIANELLRLTE